MPPRRNNRDSRVVAASFPVWLAKDFVFNNPPGQNIRTYPAGTEAQKVPYSEDDCRYMDRMEGVRDGDTKGAAVAIRLDGRVRYVWRSDIMTEKEYEVWKRNRDRVGSLRKKPKGSLDQDGADGHGDPVVLAGADPT